MHERNNEMNNINKDFFINDVDAEELVLEENKSSEISFADISL